MKSSLCRTYFKCIRRDLDSTFALGLTFVTPWGSPFHGWLCSFALQCCFVVLARNCLASMLDYIVMQMRTSVFASRFQPPPFRALRDFFGQQSHRPQVRKCPYTYGSQNFCLLLRSFMISIFDHSIQERKIWSHRLCQGIYSDTHRYVTYCHLCANQRFIGCRNKGFFCSVVGKI